MSRAKGMPRNVTMEERLAWRATQEKVGKVRAASASYLGAIAARRDARRLIDLGCEIATRDALVVLHDEKIDMGLDVAIEMVAAKDAADLLDLYDRAPDEYPDGRTADTALAAGMKNARSRYRHGKCCFCKGPALDCAERHAEGKSCA